MSKAWRILLSVGTAIFGVSAVILHHQDRFEAMVFVFLVTILLRTINNGWVIRGQDNE